MLGLAKMQEIILSVADDLISREEELCLLDSYVGDGDHGVTIKRGFQSVKAAVSSQQFDSFQSLFMGCALELMNTLGGAIGPIFSSVFMGFAQGTANVEEIGTQDLARMFQLALDCVKQTGGAKEGDRTLVDALSPAARVLQEQSGLEIHEALSAAAGAAYEGALSTKDMVAKMGRARFLGEKSKGYVDAGAMTMYYFIHDMAQAVS